MEEPRSAADRLGGIEGADEPATESKPWCTTLASESHQAGVANEPPADGEPQ